MKWQIEKTVDAIVFDCDGTLSEIEGIDWLAEHNSVGEEVKNLTAAAMGTSGLNPHLYQKRLELVKPTLQQLHDLAKEYFKFVIEDAVELITVFKLLKKNIYIISAGLNPAVTMFGESINIPAQNIFAVDAFFKADGSFKTYATESSLIQNNGKRIIISALLKKNPNIVYVGDGLNDCSAADLASRFIGYGGAYFRENIEKLCSYYIYCQSLAALLPLSLTIEEAETLPSSAKKLFAKGLQAIIDGKVKTPIT